MSFLSRYEELGESFSPKNIELKPALRVNTLKTTTFNLARRLKKKSVHLEKISFAPGYYYNAEFSLGATPEYLQGFYYLQEAASQLPAIVLDPQAGDFVLDMAAAPGSKTTQMAQMMNNEGSIIALDSDAHRLVSLKNNIERLGISNTIVYKKDARFASDLKTKFDKILLDAPCSGNFCVEPEFFKAKTMEGIHNRTKIQKDLLKSANKVLKPGGTLLYSTCSLEPEENEFILDWLLSNFPELSLEETKLKVGDPALTTIFGKSLNPSISKARRLWPHKTGTQGFFIAKIIKEK